MKERFVSEEMKPLPGDFEFQRAAPGEPALPRRFRWRGEILEVAGVERQWKSTSPCTHGSGERYVRRHWYDIATADGRRLRIYFERTARSPRQAKRRWWIFSQTDTPRRDEIAPLPSPRAEPGS